LNLLCLAHQIAVEALEPAVSNVHSILRLFDISVHLMSQAGEDSLRCFGSCVHQSHSPLQSGLGRFEQLAEHL